jgi:hypothetical protein
MQVLGQANTQSWVIAINPSTSTYLRTPSNTYLYLQLP